VEARSHSRSATRTPGIERAERLVEKQEARLDREGAGEWRHAGAARPRAAREAPLEAAELDEVEELGDARGDLAAGSAARGGASPRGEAMFVRRRACGGRRVVLEDEADLALAGRRPRASRRRS